jgi:hypothetical protein
MALLCLKGRFLVPAILLLVPGMEKAKRYEPLKKLAFRGG